MTTRLIAIIGTLCLTLALVLLWMARLSIPYDVYVSELGAPGMPTAQVFEAVLLLITAGGILIASAGRDVRARARVFRWWRPSLSLLAASIFFLIDSQVTCTFGCPLPVGATFTAQNFVHTLAAVLAFAAASWAIMQCASAVGHPALARFSFVAAIAVAAASTAGGLMSLFHFHAVWGGRFELLATTIGLAWIVAFGASLAVAGPALQRSAPHEHQQLVGQTDEPVDLVLVPVDPAALRFAAGGDEAIVLLPDDKRPLGA